MSRKPNILIFMSDQQHAETAGGGDSALRMRITPRLQSLLQNGVLFQHAYTPTPMCTPARASAMTGLYPHQHKLICNAHSGFAFHNRLEDSIETIGTALQGEKYQTVYAGKWHVGESGPGDCGFGEVLELAPGSGRGTLSDETFVADGGGVSVLAAATSLPKDSAYVFRLADRVNGWLREHAADGQPFLLFASCNEPHVPWIVPEPYASLFDPAELAEWDSYRDGFDGKPMTYTKHYTSINYCRPQGGWADMARALGKYYGAAAMVDEAFGSIVSTLEQTGQLDDTVIFFMSDHGELLGRHGLVGKNELALDDIIRIPFAAYWKDRFKPGRRSTMVSLCDLFNTVLELAGAEPRADRDSRSLVRCLTEGESAAVREEIVVQHHGTTFLNVVRAIRSRTHKYVFRPHELDELYDLEQDPGERRNRIADPACADVLAQLRSALLDWAREHRDPAYGGMKLVFDNPPIEPQPASRR